MNDIAVLAELCTHLQRFAEQEKAELARRLHDELGGLLTAAKMDLSWLQSRSDQPVIQQRLTQLGNMLDEAMDLKRRVVEELRPSLLDHFGLPTALKAHVESICDRAALRCSVSIADDLESIPMDMAIALFRVIEEGLSNVVRHAQARQVRIELLTDAGERHVLRLIDDGQGMDLTTPGFHWTHGLAGMRHRVETLGGCFTIDSKPGQGTVLTISLPRAATISNGRRRQSL